MPSLIRLVPCVLAWTCLASVAGAQTSRAQMELRHKQLKAEHDRRAAEMKRKLGPQANPHRTAAGLEPLKPSTRPAWNPPRSAPVRLPNQSAARNPAPFNPSQAPPPAECLGQYVATARSASSMEQILPYLPEAEARSLQEYQATYDPQQAAQSRQSLRQLNPQITDDGLTHITNPPYVNALQRHKSIAGKILEVLSITVEGDKATLEVSTTNGATVNGGQYPYSTATIELEGEGNTWKIGAYNDGNVYYQEPPKPKASKLGP